MADPISLRRALPERFVDLPDFSMKGEINTGPSIPPLSQHLDSVREATLVYSIQKSPYPRESGTSAVDHAIVNPFSLNFTGFVSDISARKGQKATRLRIEEAWKSMEEMARSRQPFTVITEYGAYANMIITELSTTRNPRAGMGMVFYMTLEQWEFAGLEPVLIDRSVFDGYGLEEDNGFLDLTDDENLPDNQSVLPVQNIPYQKFKTVLCGVNVEVALRWNPASELWTLSMWEDTDLEICLESPIWVGARLVGSPLDPRSSFRGDVTCVGSEAENPGKPAQDGSAPWNSTHRLIGICNG